MTIRSKELFERRKRRNRHSLGSSKGGHPRLSVFRSSKHIYAQVINDLKGHTVASASSIEKDLKSIKNGSDKEAAAKIGSLVAARAIKEGVTAVVFDRGGYRYHGRVKALADAARSGGLKF